MIGFLLFIRFTTESTRLQANMLDIWGIYHIHLTFHLAPMTPYRYCFTCLNKWYQWIYFIGVLWMDHRVTPSTWYLISVYPWTIGSNPKIFQFFSGGIYCYGFRTADRIKNELSSYNHWIHHCKAGRSQNIGTTGPGCVQPHVLVSSLFLVGLSPTRGHPLL